MFNELCNKLEWENTLNRISHLVRAFNDHFTTLTRTLSDLLDFSDRQPVDVFPKNEGSLFYVSFLNMDHFVRFNKFLIVIFHVLDMIFRSRSSLLPYSLNWCDVFSFGSRSVTFERSIQFCLELEVCTWC